MNLTVSEQKTDVATRASALLARVPLIDGHNDLPYVIWKDRTARGDVELYDLTRIHSESDTDLPRLRQGQVAAQIFTAFIPTSQPDPIATRLSVIDVMRQIEDRHSDIVLPALAASDVIAAQSQGKIAQIKAVEGCVGIDGNIDHLADWYDRGIRLVTLCHNETIDVCDSATDASIHDGLSHFGRDVIQALNRLGIIVDVSHASPKTMHDVLDITTAPIVWSHSNALTLCDHPRNIPDDVLERVRGSGGLVMATFVPDFVSQERRDWHRPLKDAFGKTPIERYASYHADVTALAKSRGPMPPATLSQYCDHLDYFAERVGFDHIGIGSDFFGGPSTDGLEHVGCFPAIFAELMKRGWSDEALMALAGGNFLRVWHAVAQAADRL